MSVPEVGFDYYEDTYLGTMSQDEFEHALPEARARLIDLTGDCVPDRCAEAWSCALCALCERVAGIDLRGVVASESVGSTMVSYSAAYLESKGNTDYDVVAPWLGRTGLLCAILR